jgi:putative aminopeptidase FrvX
MHTTVESVHQDDAAEVVKLIYHTIKTLKPGTRYHYI